LLKTFWPGWHDQQSPDGTVVWTDPDGHTSTSHPGSRLLFPELCTPTAEFTITDSPPPKHTAGLTMPRRTTTRAQDRRRRIEGERHANEASATQPAIEDAYPSNCPPPSSACESIPPF
jgi:hypothetical protein